MEKLLGFTIEIAAAKEAERQAAKTKYDKKLAKQEYMQQVVFQVITNIKQ
ncbi:Uncharacterised protein [Chlamydia trachomatis]|nr:Uncharacterised protein [Chlamydia trachomatis]